MAISSIVNRGMVNEGIADATALATARTVGVVESAMTLNIPSDFATLQEAMDWIEARVLLAEVTIQFANGTYNATSSHIFKHNNYAMVNIIGDVDTPSNVTINSTTNGLYLQGCQLRSVKGIKISCTSGQAIFLNRGSKIYELNDVDLASSGGYGLMIHDWCAVGGRDIYCHNSASGGVLVFMQSALNCTNLTSNNNTGWGITMSHGSNARLLGTTTMTGNSSGTYNIGLNTLSGDGSIVQNG